MSVTFAIRDSPMTRTPQSSPPFEAVRHIFDQADASKSSGERRAPKGDLPGNNRQPHAPWRFWRGLVSPEGEQLGRDGRDRKRTIDLTTQALASRRLTQKLGEDLQALQTFFGAQEVRRTGLVPLLVAGLKRLFGLEPAVLGGGRMHRLLDYREEIEQSGSPRCHSHSDFGTFTLLWQDTLGLEVEFGDEGWVRMPQSGVRAVVVAGRALSVLTSGMTVAAPHRVVAPPRLAGSLATPRRSSIALFVEPAKSQLLQPMRRMSEEPLEAMAYGTLKQRLRYEPGHEASSRSFS
mmetsp:Transcript_93463/g.263878  ORF Transcript_93463/g.263878 Transcript_93463/m.263878 type:complete len:292 (-) Transcript_93463:106-981(-)